MACANHPDVPDVTRCAQCRKRVCQDCYVILEGRPLCGSCKDQVVRLMERGESVTSGDRGPTPWERKKSFDTLVQTLKAAALQPGEFFRTMSLTGDGHYTYLLAVGWVPGVIGAALSNLLQGLLQGMALGLGTGTAEGAAAGLGMTVMMALMGILCAVVWVPLQLFIGLFVSGLICHFCLYILSAANAPLEATLRTVAYAQSPTVLNAIPFCGFLVAAIWSLVLQIVGLKEVHETTYARVILAVFLPTIVCLALLGGILALTLPFILRQR